MEAWVDLISIAKELIGVAGLIAVGAGWGGFWLYRMRRTDRLHDRQNALTMRLLEDYAARMNSSASESSRGSGASTNASAGPSTPSISQRPPPSSGSRD